MELCVGLSRIELAQDRLAVRMCQGEDAIGQFPILVFLDQRQACGASLSDPGDETDTGGLFLIQNYPALDSDNRIKHGTLAARQRCEIPQRQRIDEGISATNETHPVCFIGQVV